MASDTVDASSATVAVAVADGGLQAASIPIIDLRLLSQSELYSLSLCSTTDYNPCRDDDVIIPKIDRRFFNESAASHKQTYSRIPLAPAASSSSIRSRTSPNNGPDNSECPSPEVVTFLKQLFGYPTDSVPVPVPELGNVGSIGQKRKRGRKGKNENGKVAEVEKTS